MKEHKRVAIIDGEIYQVSFPQCEGCEHLCLPYPSECLFPGDGCKYPNNRLKAEGKQTQQERSK